MTWPMRFSSTLAASLLTVLGPGSAGLAAQSPAPQPAPAPQQKPAQAAPRAPAPAPAAPAPVGMADQTPFYEGEYIPGLKNLPTEELAYPHLEANESSGGGAQSTGSGASAAEEGAAVNRPGFFKRAADRLGADRTLFNIVALIVIIGAFVLYRIRSGRNRTRI